MAGQHETFWTVYRKMAGSVCYPPKPFVQVRLHITDFGASLLEEQQSLAPGQIRARIASGGEPLNKRLSRIGLGRVLQQIIDREHRS